MPAVWALFFCILTVCAIVAAFMFWLPYRDGEPRLMERDRVILDAVKAQGGLRLDSWQQPDCHRAPYEPFSIDQAHREMQRLIDCTVERCPRKASAFYVLVAARHATPDSSRTVR